MRQRVDGRRQPGKAVVQAGRPVVERVLDHDLVSRAVESECRAVGQGVNYGNPPVGRVEEAGGDVSEWVLDTSLISTGIPGVARAEPQRVDGGDHPVHTVINRRVALEEGVDRAP